ncbi:MAG: outer membrane beta-barrel protein [Candidatus Solibacter sp.]
MRLVSAALLLCAIGLAQPQPDTGAYIERGKIELGFSGNVTVPHSNPGSTSGSLQVGAGYYISRSSLLGAEIGITGASAGQSYALAAHYRYLFSTRNPKLFPFIGASPGLGIAHGFQFDGTYTRFTLRGEAGLKCFVARNVSVEAAYNLHYVHSISEPPASGSSSALVFGLAFTF